MSAPPFDWREAAAEIGFPGEKFDSIAPYRVEGVYWVVIGRGDKKIGRPVIAANGHVQRGRGYAVGMAWLRHVATLDSPDTAVVPQVLRWYDALPIGWSESDVCDFKTGSVTLRPTIEMKLASETYIQPASRSAPPSDGPPNPPPGYGGPPGIGPSGGYAPSRHSRATLLEVNGRLMWIIESMDPFTKQWREELREAAE